MKKLLLLVAMLALTQPALAQEDKHSLALRTVALGFEPQFAAQIMESYWPVATELIKQRVPGLTEVQLFQYKGKTNTIASETAHAAMAPLVELFERGFSEEELRTLIAFYGSPAGIKLAGASEAVAATMKGAVTHNLADAVWTLQTKIDQMLAADGY
jgi:hypothetical protein